jgi:hypothetical protein
VERRRAARSHSRPASAWCGRRDQDYGLGSPGRPGAADDRTRRVDASRAWHECLKVWRVVGAWRVGNDRLAS